MSIQLKGMLDGMSAAQAAASNSIVTGSGSIAPSPFACTEVQAPFSSPPLSAAAASGAFKAVVTVHKHNMHVAGALVTTLCSCVP